MCQCTCTRITAWRAVVNAGLTGCHRLGIWAAAFVAALAALGLWQQAIEAFDQCSLSFSLRERGACSV